METWNGFWSEAAPARKLNTFYTSHTPAILHVNNIQYNSQLLH